MKWCSWGQLHLTRSGQDRATDDEECCTVRAGGHDAVKTRGSEVTSCGHSLGSTSLGWAWLGLVIMNNCHIVGTHLNILQLLQLSPPIYFLDSCFDVVQQLITSITQLVHNQVEKTNNVQFKKVLFNQPALTNLYLHQICHRHFC